MKTSLATLFPYLCAWLALVLLLPDPQPTRCLIAGIALITGIGMRFAPKHALALICGAASVACLIGLLLTLHSYAGFGRIFLGAAGGAFGVYCLLRAIRG